MAEIPAGEYTSHIHRSIDQLRQMNEKNAVYTLGALSGSTDLRLHDYKPYTDIRSSGGERLDYTTKGGGVVDIDRSGSANNNNNNNNNNMPTSDPHEPVDQKPYIGSPGTPPTPLSITDAQMNESKIFASKGELQIHSQLHMRESKPYKCSQCTKSFANSSYLSQHTRIHLGIKPYRCEICQRKFTQLSHLQQHIRTHTGDKPYKCRHAGCPKAFSQLSNLQSHSRCHQTDKPYKCNSCYKCFVDEAGLLEHIPKHKESKHLKTHICQYCGKSYTQETYLTKHMQKHIEKEAKKTGIAGLAGLGFNKNVPAPVEHPYWPKVSPDSAANLAEAMQQQTSYEFLQQQHQQQHGNPQNQPGQGHPDPQHHRLQDHHRLNGANSGSGNDSGEDLVVIRQNPNLPLQNSHPPVSSAPNNYDAASITKVTSNSAFTPIQTMMPHQLAQRPYFYDAINFQAKNAANQGVPNSFPNQLISLHQIRNYAHQPGIVSSEHLLAMGVGVKDKGQ